MERGDIVEAVEFGGKKIRRRVVVDNGTRIVICNEAEYRKATREGREPIGVAFPAKSVTLINRPM